MNNNNEKPVGPCVRCHKNITRGRTSPNQREDSQGLASKEPPQEVLAGGGSRAQGERPTYRGHGAVARGAFGPFGMGLRELVYI